MSTGGQALGGLAVWTVGVDFSPDKCTVYTERTTNLWLISIADGGRDQCPGSTAMSHPVAVCKCLICEHSNSL